MRSKIAFITATFGQAQIGRDGLNVAVKCPVPTCSSRLKYGKKKFVIRIDNDTGHCWVCGFKCRSLVPVLKKYGTADQLREYILCFRRDEGLLAVDSKIDVETDLELPPNTRLLAPLFDSIDPDIRVAVRYLHSRGLTEREAWRYRLCLSESHEWKKRVLFPSFDCGGKLNYFIGRAIDSSVFPKYVNCDEKKSSIVFNEVDIDWHLPLVLVEGPFDLTKCFSVNATCLLGSSIHENSELFNKILTHHTSVVILLDGSAVSAAHDIAKKLARHCIETHVAFVPNRKDPGEASEEEVLKAVESAKSWSSKSRLIAKIRAIA